MHMLFSDREKEWINMKVFGWRIKQGCPDDVRKSIEKKLNEILTHDKNIVNRRQGRGTT